MRAVCVIRRDLAWRDFRSNSENFYANRATSLWESVFRSKYREFRRDLHEIQKDNLAKVGFDVVCDLEDCGPYLAGTEFVIFPTDDDDWYHPGLLNVVMPIMTQSAWCNWAYILFSTNRLQDRKDLCATNSYCLKTPTDRKLVDNHMRASAALTESDCGIRLQSCLSLHNWSLASLSFLKKVSSAEQLAAHYQECLRPVEVAHVDDWFWPYIERMGELYRRLEPRRRLLM